MQFPVASPSSRIVLYEVRGYAASKVILSRQKKKRNRDREWTKLQKLSGEMHNLERGLSHSDSTFSSV